MRRLLFLLLCIAAVYATAAHAQNFGTDEPRADAASTPVSASVGSVITTPPVIAAQAVPEPPAEPARPTWQKRFDQANTSHDGHLTLEQAKAGYATIARHFSAIDLTSKGYVTKDDIAAWHKSQRAAHKPSAPSPLTMDPRHAFQRTVTPTLQINSATIKTLRQVPQPQVEAPVEPMDDNPTGDPR